MTSRAATGVGFPTSIFDALPFPAFIMDGELRVVAANEAASGLILGTKESVLRQKGGEALHCINSTEGCGNSPACPDCVVRTSVGVAVSGGQPIRRRARLEQVVGDHVEDLHALVTATPFTHEGQTRVLLMIENLTLLFALTDSMPICMGCKRVLDDDLWTQIEAYLDSHLDLKFSHGLCPECSSRLYPERE